MSAIRKPDGRGWSRWSTMLRLLCGGSLSGSTPIHSPMQSRGLYLELDSTTSGTQPPLSSFKTVSISIESGLFWDMRTLEQPDGTRTLRLAISAQP